jgi:hypothetical protein
MAIRAQCRRPPGEPLASQYPKAVRLPRTAGGEGERLRHLKVAALAAGPLWAGHQG